MFDKSTGPLFLIVEPMMQALLFFYIIYIVFGVNGDDVSPVAIFTMVTLWRGHVMIASNAPYYLSGQASVLQQTRYPPFALVAEGIATDAALFLLLLLIVLVCLMIGGAGPLWTWVALPAVLGVNLLFSSACAILLACLGIYWRELGLVANFGISLWMYASPVVYGMERLREPFRTVLTYTNPFVHIMPAYRQVLLSGEWPDWQPLLIVVAASVAMLAVGLKWLGLLRGRVYRYL
jgi:lipopolysaccharide transport system permease protein